jgi:iron-sulfur cluster repair protein YtfE (RIC family)
MSLTDSYRKQHVEIADLVKRIEALLDPQRLTAEAGAARALLSNLFGKLSVHLTMEDNALYPRLEKHADGQIRDLAKRFKDEMAGVRPQVEAFGQKWTESAIRSGAAACCAEARALFAALKDRIVREETQLYAQADKAA